MSEIGRRLVHAGGVGFPALYLTGLLTWREVGMVLILGSFVAAVLETVRLRVGLEWWIYERLTRPYEQHKLAGYALYMFSITVVGLAFEPAVAIPAMLMLMLGDPVSGYLSSGELRRVKHRVSIVAMFGVSLAVALPFTVGVFDDVLWGVAAALLGAAVATVADGVTLVVRDYVIDDNITIPLAGAIALWLAYEFFPLGV